MMAGSPLVSLAKFGEASGSMLTALSEKSSFCAASNCPWRHSSARRLAICSVFMAYSFQAWRYSSNEVLLPVAGRSLAFSAGPAHGPKERALIRLGNAAPHERHVAGEELLQLILYA